MTEGRITCTDCGEWFPSFTVIGSHVCPERTWAVVQAALAAHAEEQWAIVQRAQSS